MTPEPVPGTEADVMIARGLACFVDSVLATFAAVAGSVAGAFAAAGAGVDATAGRAAVIVGFVLAYFLYFVAFEALVARTPAKWLTETAVVDRTDGSPCSTKAALVRNLLRPVDMVGGYAVGTVVMLVTDYQRVGDLAGGTTVVATEDYR